MEETVGAIVEDAVNGVEDMIYMSSKSANDGSYTLTVTFNVGADADMAFVRVQNRIKLAGLRYLLKCAWRACASPSARRICSRS